MILCNDLVSRISSRRRALGKGVTGAFPALIEVKAKQVKVRRRRAREIAVMVGRLFQ